MCNVEEHPIYFLFVSPAVAAQDGAKHRVFFLYSFKAYHGSLVLFCMKVWLKIVQHARINLRATCSCRRQHLIMWPVYEMTTLRLAACHTLTQQKMVTCSNDEKGCLLFFVSFVLFVLYNIDTADKSVITRRPCISHHTPVMPAAFPTEKKHQSNFLDLLPDLCHMSQEA